MGEGGVAILAAPDAPAAAAATLGRPGPGRTAPGAAPLRSAPGFLPGARPRSGGARGARLERLRAMRGQHAGRQSELLPPPPPPPIRPRPVRLSAELAPPPRANSAALPGRPGS